MAFGFEHELRDEIARLRLTDAEREAIGAAIDRVRDWVLVSMFGLTLAGKN